MVGGDRGVSGGRGVSRGRLVSGGRGVGLGLGVDSGSLVGDISDISIIAVAGVLDVLDSAVRESNRVGSGDVGGTIGLLLSVEVGLGVVISDGEGEGGNLIGVGLGLVGGGSVVGRGGGVISGGGVHSMVDRGHNHGGVVDGVVSHGVDGVSQDVGVGVVTSIRTGSHDGEESSSDESLHFCSIGV